MERPFKIELITFFVLSSSFFVIIRSDGRPTDLLTSAVVAVTLSVVFSRHDTTRKLYADDFIFRFLLNRLVVVRQSIVLLYMYISILAGEGGGVMTIYT